MAILFWPFMVASVVLSILAICIKKPVLLVISSLLIVPLALYLSATPRFGIWGLLFPFFYIGSAVSLAKGLKWLSVLLIVPNFILISWLGFAVMTQ